MAVFYSFHYERDANRVSLIRNMGAVEGQRILNSQEWESVKRGGSQAIANWIDEQMKYKTAVVVLIGAETADRPWVQYEIEKAWDDRKPLLGIRIHGLADMGNGSDFQGRNPFLRLQKRSIFDPSIPIFDPTVTSWDGRINTQATYRKLKEYLNFWVEQGVTRA